MIHETAIVESEIGHGTMVFAFTHVLAGAKIGCDVKLADHVFVEGGAIIGNNVTVKNNVSVWDGVIIEDDVFIGPNVCFTNDLTPRSPRMESAKHRYSKRENWILETKVKRGASIGGNSTIVPGVTIGQFAFVGAGATVTKDVKPYTLVVGNPARPKSSVCSCGKQLPGCYLEATCEYCGETPATRHLVCSSGLPKPLGLRKGPAFPTNPTQTTRSEIIK